ncbi:putative sensory histidine kinase (Phosphotransfer intermediate) associated with the RcsBC two-component regulatory system [Xenorhabdus poinarii G6]|uniref:Putative sensory histidine kinase (Phosphotransfer intermediate) associated with the RcsBC two-component regulatory system n=1 Tax=Xenorhabdus poinarii G6 TaxID=1354304 RepID=A0A068QZM7_9GAMM|nr:phosphotransferase RcsD [Xenorhabdus poinarii]CDG20512.1 putative sensory histidine kinase (Phosphotransfer intermediate) associated with the RcsBC two-component regulatory system [Xenorhabdus poinarii G6]
MYKQPPIKPSAILRFYVLFVILLFTSLFLFGYNYFDIWLMEKKYAISSVAAKMRLQIKDYRYHANHIFKLSNTLPDSPQEKTPLFKSRPDVYWLEDRHQSVDAIIFGQYNNPTIQLAQRLSSYLDILWGSHNEYLSMYYLNGRENNLLLITTHSVIKPGIRFQDSYLIKNPGSRRIDMLDQSITLDEKESISFINVLRDENIYFYTYKAAFNAAGQVTTVIAFDLPINNLLPVDMSPANFRLQANNVINEYEYEEPKKLEKLEVSLNGFWLEFSQPLNIMPYTLIYQVPLKVLIVDLLFRNVWLLLSILLFFLFSLSGLVYIRRRYIAPNAAMSLELQIKEALNRDIISNISVGVIVYDFAANELVTSNKAAKKLMPYLELNKVRAMAQQHHGLIQTAINEAIYDVKMYSNSLLPDTCLFLLQDKDQEIMANKRLQLAHREYDKNLQIRQVILSNIHHEIKDPMSCVNEIATQLKQLSSDDNEQDLLDKLLVKSAYIAEWIEDVALLNALESGNWQPENDVFSLSSRLEDILQAFLPTFNLKGLMVYYHFNIPPETLFMGDGVAVSKIVSLLFNYAITTTSYGKISLIVNRSGQYDNHIKIELVDSGAGLSERDLMSLNFPFLNPLAEDKYSTHSGMAFYLCNQLCKKMGGSLDIKSKLGLGTHYVINLLLPQYDDENGKVPQILAGVKILMDINNPEIKKIIHTYLNHYGAEYVNKRKENITERYDIILTDKPHTEERPTLLLVGSLTGFKQLAPGVVQCNYNFVDDFLNAISFLIEENASLDEEPKETSKIAEPACDLAKNIDSLDSHIYHLLKSDQIQLANSEYRKLFIETIPMDMTKLYSHIEQHDWISLSQTVHRLKGAFAMLDLKFLRSSCEALEKHIADNNEVEIKKSISLIDSFVTKLLQQGNQQYEEP